jgi:signal transduction histidine kinase
MEQNQLFHRTRLRLAAWYVLVMGCIMGLSGLGVYQVVARAHRESIDQALNSAADALHKSLEPVWQQKSHLQQIVRELSLQICVTNSTCINKTVAIKNPIAAANPVNYYLRLVDRSGRPIAIAGIDFEQLPMSSPTQRWRTLKDRTGIQYRQISLPLYTTQQLSGYVEVGRSLQDLEQHLAALRLTLLLGLPIVTILIAIASWWLAGLAMRPIYRSYHQMQQFTADAAHEFRTPLAAMQSTIQAALKLSGTGTLHLPESATGGALEVLKRQITRMSQMVGDLLLLTRIDQQLKGEYQKCCLNDIVSDLGEELASLAIEAKVTLCTQVQQQEKLEVLGNEEQLYCLISNLVGNAIQATPSGGKVTVLLENSDRYALIHVQDTGRGIALEHQTRIFDRFYRVNRDRSRASGGSGLGLAIAQAITKAHGGSIRVQSEVGVGSTFTVQLPVA